MTATATSVSRKPASGSSTWRRRANVRRVSKLDREPRQTNGNNIFRWYRAGWGRYTQSDPVGLAGGFNLFGYAAGNPLMRIDPLGRVSFKVASPTYRPGTWDQTVVSCKAYAYGCTRIDGSINCDCKCSDGSWRASVSINITSHAAYYATDAPVPGSLIMAEEQQHITENVVRLNTLKKEGEKLEAKKYPLKILCSAECKAYELWGFTMMVLSGPYTHVTDPCQRPVKIDPFAAMRIAPPRGVGDVKKYS